MDLPWPIGLDSGDELNTGEGDNVLPTRRLTGVLPKWSSERGPSRTEEDELESLGKIAGDVL